MAKLTKLYYSIGEVADMFDVNQSLIRFWEKEFNAIKPKKNRKGNRLYTIKDIEQVYEIYTLVKIQGFTLDGAKRELKTKISTSSDATQLSTDEIILKLEAIKTKLLKLKTMP